MSDISRLFELDPLGLTDQDIEAIIARMRESQTQFELGVKTPAKPKKSSAGAALLKDLGLD